MKMVFLFLVEFPGLIKESMNKGGAYFVVTTLTNGQKGNLNFIFQCP